MIRLVFFVWLSFIVASVTTTPVPQLVPALQYPTYQQSAYKNLPVAYQPDASTNNLYTQQGSVQNQTPRQLNAETVNQLLISKILGNPGLQKILDPNTRLYNQNGQEIQRQPKTGAGPNVINNYFIVPPEFFNLNDTKPVARSKNVHKRRKVQSGKKTPVVESERDPVIFDDFETKKSKKNNGRNRKGEKRNQKRKFAKLLTEDPETDINPNIKPEPEVKKIKRKRKPGLSTKTESIKTSPSDESNDDNLHKNTTISPANENNNSKKQKQPRKQSKVTKEESLRSLEIQESTAEVQDNVSLSNKKATSTLNIEKTSTPEINDEKCKDLIENVSHLKNIESPVDNSETKDLKENRDTKRNKDTRETRNPKPDRVKQSPTQKMTPEEMLKNFFPYMYNFFKGNNYPFNFEKFYQPNFNKNNRVSKKNKEKRNRNEQNKKESLPKVIKVKVKAKNNSVTTTMNPLSIESGDDIPFNSASSETTTLPSGPEIPMQTPHEIFPEQNNEEELKPSIPKTEFAIAKANLEMPPSFIEDLHEYITPDLRREDIIPTIHTNGIINDYYPIFNDDSYYTNDESYYLKDLEDDRDFYTTDHSDVVLLNRDRRKYDRTEDFRRQNFDIKDRINFRRGKYQVSDRLKDVEDNKKNSILRPYTHEKIVEPEKAPETYFRTPPSLENPDFRTKKIDKEFSKFDIKNHELQEPIYTDSVENLSDYKTFSDIKPAQFSGLMNWDSDIEKENTVPTNGKPRNDRIETVFAKTRVVKYGAAKVESEENTSTPVYENYNGDKYYSDGHTTFVVAKSLGHVDDYHW